MHERVGSGNGFPFLLLLLLTLFVSSAFSFYWAARLFLSACGELLCCEYVADTVGLSQARKGRGKGRLLIEMADRPPPLPGAKKGQKIAAAPKGPLKAVPPPVDQMKPYSEKGMLEKQLMGEGRYSTLFRASSFELFVPKNRVRAVAVQFLKFASRGSVF